MEHEQAMKTNAAERYLLGELAETEADSFEDHFFDCRACAEDIRQGALMLKAGRQVAIEDRQRDDKQRDYEPSRVATIVPIESHPRARTWFPAAAAAMLIIGIALPLLVQQWPPAKPRQIEFVPLYLGGAARGVADENVVPAGHKNLLLQVDVASTTPFPSYVLTVRDERGKSIASKTVPAAQTEEPVPLLLSELPARSYVVVIEGVREDGKRSGVTTLSFRVR